MANIPLSQVVLGNTIPTSNFKPTDQAITLSNDYDSWSASSSVGVVAEESNFVYISPTLTTSKALPANSMISGVSMTVSGIYLPAPYGLTYCRVFFFIGDGPDILNSNYASADLTQHINGIYSEGSGYVSGILSLNGFATNQYKYCAFGVGVALQLDPNVYRNKAQIGANSVVVTYDVPQA